MRFRRRPRTYHGEPGHCLRRHRGLGRPGGDARGGNSAATPRPRVLLVGTPNVGKSVLFHRLTGVYVTVSNYPGTTVEVARGYMRWAGREIEVVDTPGMYSLRPTSEEERVARDMVLREPASVLVHVLDVKNLARMLCLTFELLETGIPLIVAANMADEADRYGIIVKKELIQERLGVPVVLTSAPDGEGVEELRSLVASMVEPDAKS